MTLTSASHVCLHATQATSHVTVYFGTVEPRLLPCARMRSRVMRLVVSVCVRTYVCTYVRTYMYIYLSTKKQAV